MKCKRFDKRLWPMFWLGLAIWLGMILVMLFMEMASGDSSSAQGVLMDAAKSMFQGMPIFTLLLLCLIQPIIEEFSFRLWGVGKLWTMIVCVILMSIFAFSEMGLWAVLFIGGFIAEWILDKKDLRRKWLLTLISSACFALCHVSGFGAFSLSMVLGLIEIFGMAILMCWLTLNLSIWFSALLHVLNNSLSILLPMLFVPDPVSMELASASDPGGEVKICMEPLRPMAFAENKKLANTAGEYFLQKIDTNCTDFQLMGEPAEIASWLAWSLAPQYTYFEFEGAGESLEERVLFKWHAENHQMPDLQQIFDHFPALVKSYNENLLIFDTAEVMLKDAYLVYKDGHEEYFDYGCEDYTAACPLVTTAGYRIVNEFEWGVDSTLDSHVYCLPVPNPLVEQMKGYEKYFNLLLPFRIEYRDARKATLITIKTK